MNVFGLGPGELLLVMVLALIVFGPAKLPEIAAGLGKAIREFRAATSQITQEINRELQLEASTEQAARPRPSTAIDQPEPAELPALPEPAPTPEAAVSPVVASRLSLGTGQPVPAVPPNPMAIHTAATDSETNGLPSAALAEATLDEPPPPVEETWQSSPVESMELPSLDEAPGPVATVQEPPAEAPAPVIAAINPMPESAVTDSGEPRAAEPATAATPQPSAEPSTPVAEPARLDPEPSAERGTAVAGEPSESPSKGKTAGQPGGTTAPAQSPDHGGS